MSSAIPPRDRMFFVLGRGRSGTTLLKTALDLHPALSVAPEALWLMNLHRSYAQGPWPDRRVARFCHHVFFERRMRRWGLEREALEARLLARNGERSFAGLSAEVYEAHADATGKARDRLLGDKNPRYSLCAEPLLTLFPYAKFIHVVRDYRANVHSFLHVPFDLKSPIALAHRWVRYNEAILRVAKRAPNRFHLLRFEDLVAAPGPTLEALCRFLGVGMETQMLQSHEAGGGYGAAWHDNVGRPIDPRFAERWRQGLSADQVRAIDRVCQPFAEQFGYVPAGSDPPLRASVSSGAAIAWGLTALERHAFRLPIALQTLLNNTYRRLTGNLIR